MPSTTTICQEADKITTGARADVYGHPSVNFANIADLCSTYLGVKVTAEQVALAGQALWAAQEQPGPPAVTVAMWLLEGSSGIGLQEG